MKTPMKRRESSTMTMNDRNEHNNNLS